MTKPGPARLAAWSQLPVDDDEAGERALRSGEKVRSAVTKGKTTRSKKSKRTQPRKRRAPAAGRPKKRPASSSTAIEPSMAGAPRTGRPSRLTRALVAQFLEHLRIGLPLGQCAALCSMRSAQMSDWLREGRRDIEAGRATIEAEFSDRVCQALAELQKQHLSAHLIYTRMAEGWSPGCKYCVAKSGPCGRHRKNLRLAADLNWKMLTHRFARDWNASTVRHEIGSGDDDGGSTTPPGEEGERPAMVAGLVVFMPRRNEGI